MDSAPGYEPGNVSSILARGTISKYSGEAHPLNQAGLSPAAYCIFLWQKVLLN